MAASKADITYLIADWTYSDNYAPPLFLGDDGVGRSSRTNQQRWDVFLRLLQQVAAHVSALPRV